MIIIIIIRNLRLLSLGSSVSLFHCTLEDNYIHSLHTSDYVHF